ncbi:MAG: glycosyltransferase [Bdellovibrionales bacterium]|nr:glycosyltransferase [Bdellovibrionales bacterium]
MTDYPLISIVVPTYNHAQYLPICLDGIWFQDYPNIEIIVVNANSPDNTNEVLENYQSDVKNSRVSYASYFNEKTDEVERFYHDRYPKEGRRLEIVTLPSDPGLSETYNEGVRRAEGVYVTTIVSDDIPHPRMISRLAAALDADYDFAYSDELLVLDNGRVEREFIFPDFCPQRCLADWYLCGNSKLWRRSLHEKIGYFSTQYPMTQDYELFARFFMEGAKFIHVPEVLYSVRFHDHQRKTGNHTADREPKIFSESKDIAKRVREFLRGQP